MNASWQRPLAATAFICAAFCLFVSGILLGRHSDSQPGELWKSPRLLELREQLARDPKSAVIKEQIRRSDVAGRRALSARLAFDRMGAWLLLVAGIGLVAAGRAAARLQKRPLPPRPKIDPDQAISLRAARTGRALTAAGVGVACALVGIRLAYPSLLVDNARTAESIAQKLPVEDLPSPAEFQTNWPRFRGWDGSGVYAGRAVTNSSFEVLWKSAIPAPGQNSPIVWGNRVFISGGTAEKREVFCYDAAGGALLWRQGIGSVAGKSSVPDDAGWASPTMATDGRRACVIFGNGDLAALKFDGTLAWSKNLGPIKNGYGYGASLAIWQNQLLVQLDQGDSKPAGSKLICLQCSSGKILWEASRPVTESWATPIVIETAHKAQVVAVGNPWAIGCSLSNGQELWRANLLENEVVPSPIFAGGFVLLASPGSRVIALKPGGTGDVTKTGIAWSFDDGAPDIPSPVSADGLVFTVTASGLAGCFQTADGKKIWDHDLAMEVSASPGIINDNVVVLGKDGTVLFFKTARGFQELSRAHFQDGFIASPAFANGHVFLRGAANLYCLASATEKFARKP